MRRSETRKGRRKQRTHREEGRSDSLRRRSETRKGRSDSLSHALAQRRNGCRLLCCCAATPARDYLMKMKMKMHVRLVGRTVTRVLGVNNDFDM